MAVRRSAIDPGHGCQRRLKILANELYPRLENDDGLSFLARLDNSRAERRLAELEARAPTTTLT